MNALNSTTYYDLNRYALFEQYRGCDPEVVHGVWATTHLNGRTPGAACDIGAGAGRDAHWLADQGWQVHAVEPSGLRELAETQAHPRIAWIDDRLPDLQKLRTLSQRFDLLLLCAVWMHLPESSREHAFHTLVGLLKPSGLLVISLRTGRDEDENRARGFHPTNANELIRCAASFPVSQRGRYLCPDSSRAHIDWEWLVFERTGP